MVNVEQQSVPVLQTNDTEWLTRALCRKLSLQDRKVFFPVKNETLEEREVREREAKQYCGRCVVSKQCLTQALIDQEDASVLGCTTHLERRQIRRDITRRMQSGELTPTSKPTMEPPATTELNTAASNNGSLSHVDTTILPLNDAS